MAAPNPSVSVFHFTQRVSSAKIRKYKLATERGMGGGIFSSNPAPNGQDASPTPDSSTMDRPAKRPKLKLSVRPPSDSPDTIAVSRPRRESSLKIRYSENMVIDSPAAAAVDRTAVAKPSPAASSEISSLTSLNSIEKDAPPPKPAAAVPSKPRDYGRDFMSYYVADGDDEETEDEVVEVKPPPTKLAPPKQGPGPAVMQQPPRPQHHEHHMQPTPLPRPVLHQPRPIPQPTVHLIDTTPRAGIPATPDTIAIMIKKLEALTQALTEFGDPAHVPQPPKKENKPDSAQSQPKTQAEAQAQASGENNNVDRFLAMFDDDSESEGSRVEVRDEASDDNPKTPGELDYVLPREGEADKALVYGIQFIQNALRSWVQQRLQAQYTQHYLNWQQRAHEAAQPPKRGPGRPRRFEIGDEGHHYIAPPPLNIQYDLAKTPEGVAIAAFQDVLDCGCLQINARMPLPLTQALSLMYTQIDHLINQGSKNNGEWHCMSYGAQIEAHKARVEKWTRAHAIAQEEMARQQQLAHQQTIQQMGIAANHRSLMTAEQAQKQHAIDLERKRSLQHAAQQPHLTKYLTNPLKLDGPAMNPAPPVQPQRGPVRLTPVIASHGQGAPGTQSSAAAPIPNNPNLHSSPLGEGKIPSLEQLRAMPNLFSRSGQSMRFSFAPTSELAVKAFGAQAFPTAHTGPYIPNRGPMSANPLFINSHSHHMANGVYQQSASAGPAPPTPTPTPAPMPAPAELKPSGSGSMDAQAQGPAAQASGNAGTETPSADNNTHAHNAAAASPPTDTIAVASGGREGKEEDGSSSMPTRSPRSPVVVVER